MPTIPQEYIIVVFATVILWLILQISNTAHRFWYDWKLSHPNNNYEHIFELAWQYGEQLLEKHGADKSTIENVVLDWATKYMIAAGVTPPARDVAIGIIRAVGRQFNQARDARMGK